MVTRGQDYVEVPESEAIGTVIELFSGVGGFRLALARAGLRTVYSNQWEPSTRRQHASEIYVHHFGDENHSNQDITEVVRSYLEGSLELPRADVVVGGFPCQDYSVAKARNAAFGIEGKKGVLWWSIHGLLSKSRPRFVFLENVDRLLKSPTSQRGRDFAVMLRTLGDLGYRIEWRIVNAADYGFPQRRIRVFIVATRVDRQEELSNAEAIAICVKEGILARALPVAEGPEAPLRIDLSGDLELLSKGFGIGAKRSAFENSGVYQSGTAVSLRVSACRPKLAAVLNDVIDENEAVDERYFIPEDELPKWRAQKGAKRILRVHRESGTEYMYSEGGMAFPDSRTRPSRTILTAEGGRSPSRFRHVIEDRGRFRRLTPVELERLNGFPDDWTLEGSSGPMTDARRAFFMGNALVVGLVERVGMVISTELAGESAESRLEGMGA